MKIQYMSDLHYEIGGNRLDIEPLGDVLVLAGDIDKGTKTLEHANYYAKDFDAVIVIAGNHEFYRNEYKSTLQKLREFKTKDNVFFLENSYVIINGVYFYGATMWTDLSDIADANIAEYYMNDYHIIEYRNKGIYRTLRAKDTTKIHLDSVNKLQEFLVNVKEESNVVVVTHQLPHPASVNKMYKNSALNAAYMTNIVGKLDASGIKLPQVWIHGHTHLNVETIVEQNMKLLCNPYGYHGHDINLEFNPLSTVDI